MTVRFSKHFSFGELTITNTGLPNIPNEREIGNLKRLANELEKVRKLCGNLPLAVSSGFRSEAVNKKAGGVETSAHRKGLAADFVIVGQGIKETFKLIRESDIQFDQLILEPRWIHFGLSDLPLRRQCLVYDGFKYLNYSEAPK